jgi:triphosphoribosyl-dephospho-CoA synthase
MSRTEACGRVAAAAQLACLLEASAPKPGNVSPGRRFVDLGYEDFLAAAVAIGEPLAGAGTRGLGATIRLAVDATAQWTASNTNLGIVLLLAPLARAALLDAAAPDGRGGPSGLTLREALRRVLAATTVDDAREVYAAIRVAAPGGLGQVESQDVGGEPTVSLLEAMRLSADRDTVAHEYASDFEVTFDWVVPALESARRDGLSWDDAVVETFLTVLASRPDTHIARRGGPELARQVTDRARRVVATGGVRSAAGRQAVERFDEALRDDQHKANPGTTADLTAAAIFVVLLGQGFRTAPE